MSPPRSHPHPLSLFSLVPYNERAKEVVKHPLNKHLTYTLSQDIHAIDIGFHIGSDSCSPRVLAVLGRGEAADVHIDGSSISKIQCSFEVHLDTKVVMLFDRSSAQTTQVYRADTPSATVTPFEHGRPLPRKVVVMEDLNEIIGMGGTGRNLVQFKMEWHQDLGQTTEKIKKQEGMPQHYKQEVADAPRLAHTLSQELDTVPPSRMETRPHNPSQLRMRYQRQTKLGGGTFGIVYKALDLDSGRFMAAKMLKRPEHPKEAEQFQLSLHYSRKREVETLSKISHPHIVEFIHSQGWGGPEVEIFMGLKDGCVSELLERGEWQPQQLTKTARLVLHQILQALDFLAANGVIHRDVKPDNILYVSPLGGENYRFLLGDFGLCNQYDNARTEVGTSLYKAPEVHSGDVQTHRVDIWSLLVTMLWVLDTAGFRRTSVGIPKEARKIQHVVMETALSAQSKVLLAMARTNPDERASAAQLLDTYFGGEGLTTSGRIPSLPDYMDIDTSSQ